MSLPYRPHDLKEFAIEWALQKGAAATTLHDIPQANLENMAMLNTDDLDTIRMGSVPFTGSDLTIFLQEDAREQQRYRFLRETLMGACRVPELRKRLVELMDDEIMALNLSDAMGSNVEFNRKVGGATSDRN